MTNLVAMIRAVKSSILSVGFLNVGSFRKVADAELFALVQALQSTNHTKYSIGKVNTFSNSQAAIFKFNGVASLAVQAKRLAIQLTGYDYLFYIPWCPSYTGILGNEKADTVAKETQRNPAITTRVF